MKRIIPVLLLALQLMICQQGHAAATAVNSDYACAPPYLSQNAKPNINLVLDYTRSMLGPAYISCRVNTTTGLTTDCTSSSPSTETYDSTNNYYGYFNSGLYYKYNSSGYWEENSNCTNTDRQGVIGTTASAACLSGNVLNFATTTRVNVLRKILTGGRFNTTTNVYTAEGANYVLTDSVTNCKFTLAGTATTGRTIKFENSTAGTCSLLGGAPATATYIINNKTTTPEEVTGVVQSMYPSRVDLELSVYNADVGAVYRTGKNKAIADYVSAINTETPIQLTNTGTALTEAKNYFRQSGMTTANTTLMVAKNDATKDPYTDTGPLAAPCRKSFVLLISDGEWNSGSDPVIPAYYMRMNDLRTDTNMPGQQSVTTYAVYAFGDGDQGRNAMINTAMWGGFDDRDSNNAPYPFSAVNSTQKASGTYSPFNGSNDSKTYPSSTTTFPISACDPSGTWTAACAEWDREKTGLPYNFFEASDGYGLQTGIIKALTNILGRIASGSAASVMGNNDNSGSTLLQVLFYPEKTFESGTKATWLGELQSFWYFVDPSLKNITIREDSDTDKKLKLAQDKIIEFTFDGTDTLVKRFADDGDGAKDNPAVPESTVTTDDVNALWRAGKKLWDRDPADRTIFTSDPTQTAATKLSFKYESAADDATLATLFPYMDTDSTQAINIIRYVRGIDDATNYRNRTVTIGSTEHVWKLGDIIHSTPKLLSEVRLNSYNLRQPGGYSDKSYDQFIKSKDYNRRGAAYVGGNDGMLHAFALGSTFDGTTRGTVAELKDADGVTVGLGKELWAFIPKHTLPYLQYLLDPSYQHIYMVDATPLLVDASINPTKYIKDSTTITCDDATYSQCVKKTTVSDSTGLLNYDTTSANSGTSWRTLLLGSTGMGGAVSPTKAKINGLDEKIGVTGNGKYFHCASCDFTEAGFTVGMVFKASGFVDHNIYCVITQVEANKFYCSDASMNTGNEVNVATAVLQQLTVKTPIMDPGDTATPKTKGFGYSSVFALDVTDPVTSDLASGAYPKLLWEFTDPRLGFTTVTPAIVRIKDAADTTGLQRNGKWYVVLASGPTGPIDNGWFLGLSDKKLTIFVLDLKTGELVRTFNNLPSSDAYNSVDSAVHTQVPGMPNFAFAGSLSGATTDTDKFDSLRAGAYSDDAVYIGYTRANGTTALTAWDKGGVVRLLTNNDPDPANWKVSTLIDGVGPVTSAVTKLQDATSSQLWLYFGTGRYYAKDDDPSNVQSLFGIKDPCFISGNIFAPDCATNSTYTAPTVTAATASSGATFTGLVDQTSSVGTVAATDKGWKIDLTVASGSNYPKRVITDTLANTNGVVNFTTFTPSKEVCSYGGNTSVWAVKYDTGGNTLVNGKQKLKGQLLMQLSTGAFQQIDVSSAFTVSGWRETPSFQGVGSPPVLTANTNHFPTKRFLHIQER